ncbi:MAG: hypothetical protein KDE55_14350 [Novosphingobium sp.]|nr:hypothetical protein [Novosphingobium sp.]
MARHAEQLVQDRAVRNSARRLFDERLALVREDMEARGVGGRIADKLGDEARDAFEEAVEIANDNRAIVAGTIGALALWILRNPIIGWIDGLLGGNAGDEQIDLDEKDDSDE